MQPFSSFAPCPASKDKKSRHYIISTTIALIARLHPPCSNQFQTWVLGVIAPAKVFVGPTADGAAYLTATPLQTGQKATRAKFSSRMRGTKNIQVHAPLPGRKERLPCVYRYMSNTILLQTPPLIRHIHRIDAVCMSASTVVLRRTQLLWYFLRQHSGCTCHRGLLL